MRSRHLWNQFPVSDRVIHETHFRFPVGMRSRHLWDQLPVSDRVIHETHFRLSVCDRVIREINIRSRESSLHIYPSNIRNPGKTVSGQYPVSIVRSRHPWGRFPVGDRVICETDFRCPALIYVLSISGIRSCATSATEAQLVSKIPYRNRAPLGRLHERLVTRDPTSTVRRRGWSTPHRQGGL